jgi:phospholipase/lecithinase/hemolysin
MPSFSGVFVFGDSLVDPGNDLKVANQVASFPFTSLPNGAPTADKGYFLGRFTNGFNYADLVSNKFIGEATQATYPYGVTNTLLGVSIGSVSRPSGNNLSFAYGGAMATKDDPAPSLGTQVSIYHSFTADPNALYIINIGSNDVLSMVPTSGATVTGAAADQQLASIAQEIANDVVRLLGQGVQHVVVSNIPDLGVVPAYAGAVDEASRRALLTQYAQTVNSDLQSDLNAIALPSGATLQTFDFFGYTDAATSNPAGHGFTNVTQALTSVQPTSPPATGDGFLFFDKLHPTAQAHAQIASLVVDQLEGVTPSWTAAAAIGPQAGASVDQGATDNFAATLAGGQTYVIDALGISSGSGTLSDPKVTVVDSAGNVVASGDDGGLGLDTHFSFTAPASGSYTVEVSGVGVSAGSFHLQVGDSAGDNLLSSGLVQGSNMSLQGGAENDTFAAAAGSNTLFGGQGEDSILGGTGFDRVNGNQGDDVIVGRSTTGDWLLGGQGNDSINATASTGHNILNGDLGSDTVLGGTGGDSLRGGQGDDTILGGSGPDWLSGDLGHNTLTGGGGADTFHSGGGTDLVTDFSSAAGDHVAVDSGVTFTVSQAASDTVISFSNGGQMTLAGVQQTSLASDWIITV